MVQTQKAQLNILDPVFCAKLLSLSGFQLPWNSYLENIEIIRSGLMQEKYLKLRLQTKLNTDPLPLPNPA